MKDARVLIINEDTGRPGTLGTWLKAEQFQVATASGGEAGLKKAAAWRPDLIIMEAQLPAGGGLEICRRLKSSRSTRSIPVIITSRNAEPKERVRGLQAGADDYILRPFDREELLIRIHKSLVPIELRRSTFRRLERYRRLSITDSLTGLANRRKAENQLARELKQALKLERSLVFITGDIDHFKGINDNFGHGAGDDVLRKLARIIRRSIPRSYYLARPSGDEFWLICPGVSAKEAFELCERLRKAIGEKPLKVQRQYLRVTISWGISELCPDSSPADADFLIQKADRALYRSKRAGRNKSSIFRKR